jgi:hypothetical protein
LVTFFSDHMAQEKREESLTAEALAELIRTTTAPEKARLPWLKPQSRWLLQRRF